MPANDINRYVAIDSSSGTIIHLDINVVLVPDEGASLSCSHTIIIKIKQLNEASNEGALACPIYFM